MKCTSRLPQSDSRPYFHFWSPEKNDTQNPEIIPASWQMPCIPAHNSERLGFKFATVDPEIWRIHFRTLTNLSA